MGPKMEAKNDHFGTRGCSIKSMIAHPLPGPPRGSLLGAFWAPLWEYLGMKTNIIDVVEAARSAARRPLTRQPRFLLAGSVLLTQFVQCVFHKLLWLTVTWVKV